MVPGWADHSANAGPAFGKAPGPRHPRRSEGMSVRGRTMARGTAACRRGEPAAPAPGGGSGQPCREWTMGSHSPGLRRAARRCSSRERGDLTGTCGQGLHSGGERRHGANGEPEPGQGDADSPPDIPFC